MKSRDTRQNDKLGQYVIITIAAFTCYFNTLFGTFAFDDTEAVVKNKDVLQATPLSNLFKNDFWGTNISLNISHKSYRPITVLSFRLNVLLANSELNAFHFHATNVLLYILLCLITVPVFRLILKGQSKKVKDDVAFLSSLLFTVHPVHTEAVASIVGRADILASLLFLVSFLLFSHVVKQRSNIYLPLVVILILFATLCKETAVTALAVFFVYDFLVSKIYSTKITWNVIKESKIIYRSLILILSALVILFFRFKIMNFEGPTFTVADNPPAFSKSLFTKIFTYNYIYYLNLLLLIWPQWLCFDWSMGCIPLIENLYDVRVLFVVLFWCSLVFTVMMLHRTLHCSFRYVVSIIMAASLIFFPFLPASNLVLKVGFVIAERILLIPSMGFCFVIALGYRNLSNHIDKNQDKLKMLFYLLCFIFSLRTIQRNKDWSTEENLFNSALEICPLNAKVHYNVGKVAADNNKKLLAIKEYEKAIELNPLYEQAMNNLANLLREDKEFDKAKLLLERALEIRPNFAAAWMNLGIVLTNLNQSESAEHCYLTAISFRGRYPDCYYNLGNLYLDLKRNKDALAAWEKAVSFRPTHTAAWSNMLVLLDSLKQYDEVLELGKTALMHNPMSAALHFSIANTLGKVRQFEKAEKHFLEALNLNPKNALYFSNLGVLYHRWQKSQKAIEMYRKALQIDPNMHTAESNLRKLMKI